MRVRAGRGLVSLGDLEDDEVRRLVDMGVRACASGDTPVLQGFVGLLFALRSTRTRMSFASAAHRSGLGSAFVTADDLQVAGGESLSDTGRVISGLVDALVVRAPVTHSELRRLSHSGALPVINAMNSEEHPTQAVADLITIDNVLDSVDGVRFVYMGDGNSTAAALALALSRYRGVEAWFCSPRGFWLSEAVRKVADAAARDNDSQMFWLESLGDLPHAVDVVYTTQWETTGSHRRNGDWKRQFRNYCVDTDLMHYLKADYFMHDMPARRGEEVTSAVIDGPKSLVDLQARNKLWSACAALQWSLGS